MNIVHDLCSDVDRLPLVHPNRLGRNLVKRVKSDLERAAVLEPPSGDERLDFEDPIDGFDPRPPAERAEDAARLAAAGLFGIFGTGEAG